jgi:hypothetical protein
LADTIKEGIEDKKRETHVICLDKNHPPAVLAKTLATI